MFHDVPKRNLITVVLACSVLASGCSAKTGIPSNSQNIPELAASSDVSLNTNGELVNIQSSNVQSAGYDQVTQRMTVMFKDGSLYWYQPVSQSVWTAFYNAQPHPWSQVGKPELVDKGIPYGRLN